MSEPQQPTVCRMVHYVLPAQSPNAGQHRPAVICQVFNPIDHDIHPGMCNLSVFISQTNDFKNVPRVLPAGIVSPVVLVGSVDHDANCRPGTWHWHQPLEACRAGIAATMPVEINPAAEDAEVADVHGDA